MFGDHHDLIETIIVPDVFATGLGRIEEVGGGNVRFTFYTVQKSLIFNDRRREKIITARLVMPMQEALIGSKATIYAANGIEGIYSKVVIDRHNGH